MSVSLGHQEEQRARIREGLKTNEAYIPNYGILSSLLILQNANCQALCLLHLSLFLFSTPYFLRQEIGESFCRKTEQRPLDSVICGVPPVKRLARVTL